MFVSFYILKVPTYLYIQKLELMLTAFIIIMQNCIEKNSTNALRFRFEIIII